MNVSTSPVERDPPSVGIENVGYCWSYLFLSFGLLVVVAYRSFLYDESPWDLLLLVVLGGGVGTACQGRHKVLSRQWAVASLLAIVVATASAALVAWLN